MSSTYAVGPGGAIKISDRFENEDSNQKILLGNEEKQTGSISISKCDFESGSNSISCVSRKVGSKVEFIECNFKGRLDKGSHYINGKVTARESPRLHVKWCKFEEVNNEAVNIELINENPKIEIFKQATKSGNWNIMIVAYLA